MNSIVADTNALLWYLFDPGRLSPAARATLQTAESAGGIHVSVITIVELIYLHDKPTFQFPAALVTVLGHLADPNSPIKFLPVTPQDARTVRVIPRVEVPDMPDRIIAATAVAHNLPLVSSDHMIRSSAALRQLIPVIW